MRILALPLTLALASCITSPQPSVVRGGAEAQRIGRHVWHVVTRGPDFPSTARAADFVLVQAAQTTLARGSHFVILEPAGLRLDDPGAAEELAAPGQGLVIRIVAVRPHAPAPAGAIDAGRLLRSVRARLEAD